MLIKLGLLFLIARRAGKSAVLKKTHTFGYCEKRANTTERGLCTGRVDVCVLLVCMKSNFKLRYGLSAMQSFRPVKSTSTNSQEESDETPQDIATLPRSISVGSFEVGGSSSQDDYRFVTVDVSSSAQIISRLSLAFLALLASKFAKTTVARGAVSFTLLR